MEPQIMPNEGAARLWMGGSSCQNVICRLFVLNPQELTQMEIPVNERDSLLYRSNLLYQKAGQT
jgi:hypothetical protein